MVKKIGIFASILLTALLSIAAFNHIHDYFRYKEYEKEITVRLEALEKLPPSQKTPDVLYEIADLYFTLKYPQEKIMAAYVHASQAGHSHATYSLAVFSAYGKKIGQPLPAYTALFEKAAQQGSLNAAFIIKAKEALKATHMPLGYDDAFTKLVKATDNGNSEAAFLLCWHGKEAASKTLIIGNMSYCEEALKGGSPKAQYLMGRLHEQNPAEFHSDIWDKLDVEQNTSKAILFYEKAAAQSYDPAIKRLDMLKNKIPLSVTKAKDSYAYLFDPCIPCFD